MPRPAKLVSVLFLAGSTGCAAPLDNPEAFTDRAPLSSGGSSGSASAQTGGTSAGGATGGSATGGGGSPGVAGASAGGGGADGSAGAAMVGELPACVAALLAPTTNGKCSNGICHHAGADAAGGLDLASPHVSARLVDQPASHSGASPNSGCAKGDKLIDTAAPESSWLLKKLTLDASANCGAKMPLIGNLSADETTCLTTWIQSF